MKPARFRLDRALCVLSLAGLLLGGCTDTPTRTATTIRLVQPLTMSWDWQQNGAPYSGGSAVFSATSQLRVVWSFRIEAVSRPPDLVRPKYVQQFDNQDHVLFTWNGHNNVGSEDFAPGDSCVATVRYRQLDPADEPQARVTFTIAR